MRQGPVGGHHGRHRTVDIGPVRPSIRGLTARGWPRPAWSYDPRTRCSDRPTRGQHPPLFGAGRPRGWSTTPLLRVLSGAAGILTVLSEAPGRRPARVSDDPATFGTRRPGARRAAPLRGRSRRHGRRAGNVGPLPISHKESWFLRGSRGSDGNTDIAGLPWKR